MSKTMKSYQEPSREEIAYCAYGIYESEGRPHGKEQEHWLQAEAQLIAERKAQARQSTAKSAPKAAIATVAARPAPAATTPPASPGKTAAQTTIPPR